MITHRCIHLCVSKKKVSLPVLLFSSPSLCSFVSLATATCVISLACYSNWLRWDPGLPFPLVRLFCPSEYLKDFHCCVKPPPAVYNNRSGWLVRLCVHVCANGWFSYLETIFELQLAWLVFQLEKAVLYCREPKWQLRYREHGVCSVSVAHSS